MSAQPSSTYILTSTLGLLLVTFPALEAATITYAHTEPGWANSWGQGASPGTVGSAFRVNSPVWVTDLGIWDGGHRLADAHEVGLRTVDGTLLASVSFSPGTAVRWANEYRWESLPAPVPLLAGSTYVLGAAYPYDDPSGADAYLGDSPIDPIFTLLGDRATNTVTYGLTFPAHGGGLAAGTSQAVNAASLTPLFYGVGVGD